MTPLIDTLRQRIWNVNPLIIIMAGLRGVIHEHSKAKLKHLKLVIKNLLKPNHQNAIKYLIDLV